MIPGLNRPQFANSDEFRRRKGLASRFFVRMIVALIFVISSTPGQSLPPKVKLYGIDFSPYEDGQDPNLHSQIDIAQLTSRMQAIAPFTNWIRTFSCTDGLELSGMVAHSFGLKIAMNAWLSTDTTRNALEIANLIAAAKAGQVDIAIVGSEVLLRGDLSESALLAYVAQVRNAIPRGIPVTVADVYGQLIAHPNVIAASDLLFSNDYAFWEGYSSDAAVGRLNQQYQLLRAAAGTKPITISESGWPSAGSPVGAAVPTLANAVSYFQGFASWAQANSVPFFYFEAFDESWKALHGEGPEGAHWGIWDKYGNIKPGMQSVFAGVTVGDDWSGNTLVGGPGTPTVTLTYVPPYGFPDNLTGQVNHVQPALYQIVVYIDVGPGWWIKPSYALPLTPISVDGSWQANIVTGGIDQNTTKVAAFLVPNGYNPPLLSGAATLPQELFQNSVANVTVSRTMSAIYGAITSSGGSPLRGVTVSLTGAQMETALTTSAGSYSFFDLTTGGGYVVSPSKAGYRFIPSSQTMSNLTGVQYFGFSAFSVLPTNLAVFRAGQWWEDVNGDFRWDISNDRVVLLGQAGDIPVAGDWDNTGVLRKGVFRNGQWWLDMNNDGMWDATNDLVFWFGQAGDVPIVGDWDNTGVQRIGVFRNGQWWLDLNGDRQWDSTHDIEFSYGQTGDIPLIGDWNGTGAQRIGVFRGGEWWLDLNGDHAWDAVHDTVFFYGQQGDIPVIGDWNGSGAAKVGVFRQGVWWLDLNGDRMWDAANDFVFWYGQPGDLPIVGIW